MPTVPALKRWIGLCFGAELWEGRMIFLGSEKWVRQCFAEGIGPARTFSRDAKLTCKGSNFIIFLPIRLFSWDLLISLSDLRTDRGCISSWVVGCLLEICRLLIPKHGLGWVWLAKPALFLNMWRPHRGTNSYFMRRNCHLIGRTKLVTLAELHPFHFDVSIGGTCGEIHHEIARLTPEEQVTTIVTGSLRLRIDTHFMPWGSLTFDLSPLTFAFHLMLVILSSPRLNQHLYKYVIYAEGNCFWSDRLNFQLFGPSAIIKQMTPCGQFYEPLLTPFAHFVPTDFFWNNTVGMIDWARVSEAMTWDINFPSLTYVTGSSIENLRFLTLYRTHLLFLSRFRMLEHRIMTTRSFPSLRTPTTLLRVFFRWREFSCTLNCFCQTMQICCTTEA